MARKSPWVQRMFERYRQRIEEYRDVEVPSFDETEDDFLRTAVVHFALRVQQRRNIIESLTSADDWLKAALVERAARHDARVPGAVAWPEAISMVTSHMEHLAGAPRNGPPRFGPSLRRMWLEGEARGRGIQGVIDHLTEWNQRPLAPLGTAIPATFRRAKLAWMLTDDPDEPWAAEHAGRALRLRLEDFPEHAPWTLLVDGSPVGVLTDWPKGWERVERDAAPVEAPVVDIEPETWLERYLAGAHEQVWAEIGAARRTAPNRALAEAVATETMVRVRRNLDLLVPRLEAAGYRFGPGAPATTTGLVMAIGPNAQQVDLGALLGLKPKGAQAPVAGPTRVPPDPEDIAVLDGRVPVSVAAFIREVGQVDLLGQHPQICPGGSRDPLVVAPWAACWADALYEAEDELALSPTDEDKLAQVQGEDPLIDGGITTPLDGSLDPVLGGTESLRFVPWLRRSLTCGGMAGWYGKRAPAAVRALTEGFEAF